MTIRLVVTDMDGTLYSWIDYIVPAVESMVEAVCKATALPRIRVVQALKAVYTKYESNEYPFALQESQLFKEFPDFGSFDKLVIEPARMSFAEARKKYLRPYKGVVETLEALKAQGIPVVALTDAPRNPAEQRLKKMKLDQHLVALYALPGFHFPKNEEGEALVAPDILQRQERGEYKPLCDVVELPRDAEKPSRQGLDAICAKYQVPARDVLVIGDSIKKDIAMAQSAGAVDCWAEYGTYISLEYRERLDIISAPAITRRHAASVYDAGTVVKPTHALSNFCQVLDIVAKHR